jgi:hypothetical protein
MTCGRGEWCIQDFGRKTEGRNKHFEDLDVGGRIILKCILRISIGRARTGLFWPRVRVCS